MKQEYWPNDEKEQFSPESILDCPFEDEEDIYKSQINSTSITLSFSQGNAPSLSLSTTKYHKN